MAPKIGLLACTVLLLLLHNERVYSTDILDQIDKDDIGVQDGGPSIRAVSFTFAKHFQDNMVLQKAPKRANIYGFSPNIGAKVTVQVNAANKQYNYETTVKVGAESGVGEWSVTLDPFTTNTTGNVKATSNGASLELSNVIFGDVWLCSGQSNMVMTIGQIFTAAEEMADAHNYPNIRFMTVARKQSDNELHDLAGIQQIWTKPTSNTIKAFSAVCWLYGKAIHKELGTPIGLVSTNWGGTPVATWSSTDALAKCGSSGNQRRRSIEIIEDDDLMPFEKRRSKRASPHTDSVLWNSMIHPFLSMTIYGAIWYQGEADSREPRRSLYNCTFPSMIEDWRAKFNKASSGQTSADFPFGFVQLAANSPSTTIAVGFPDIRWHQTADYGYVPNPVMKNVFMAVAMDLPDFKSPTGSIHPRYKKEVGDRLALSGLAVAYGKSEMYQGPFPQQIELTFGNVVVDYGSAWELDVRDWYGFEYLCPTGSSTAWLPTNIIANNKTTVTLKGSVCESGKTPLALRYDWRQTPCALKKCSVYSTLNELPAPPFVYPTGTI